MMSAFTVVMIRLQFLAHKCRHWKLLESANGRRHTLPGCKSGNTLHSQRPEYKSSP